MHEKKVGAGSGPDPSSPANQSIDAGRLDNMSDTTIPGRRPSVGSWHRSRWDLLTVVPLALLVLAVVAVVHPPQSGPLALAFMLEEHIFIAALAILTPIALLARARVLGVALIVVVVTGGASFGSEWISLPGSGASRHDLSVMTWNLDHGLRTPAETAAELQGMTVDVIALQELEPDASAAIEANLTTAAGYPYRAMAPRLGADGLAILSRYPIESIESPDNPPYLELIVDTPRGPVRVIGRPPDARRDRQGLAAAAPGRLRSDRPQCRYRIGAGTDRRRSQPWRAPSGAGRLQHRLYRPREPRPHQGASGYPRRSR